MKIIFDKYGLKTNGSDWVIQKKVGLQWKNSKYFNSTESVVNFLIKDTFNEQTKGMVYYSANEDGVYYLLKEIDYRLKNACEEIVGVLNG